nr:MAG TPA: hypothetical protein [Caudoviricetes sp.]
MVLAGLEPALTHSFKNASNLLTPMFKSFIISHIF